MPRPELGKVTVEDELLVIPPSRRYCSNDPIPVRVTKVGRVWLDLVEINNAPSQAKSWRMRIDTQREAKDNYDHRFVTAEQYAWEQRENAVAVYLREQGVDLRAGSLWNTPERRVVLANLLRAHEDLPNL